MPEMMSTSDQVQLWRYSHTRALFLPQKLFLGAKNAISTFSQKAPTANLFVTVHQHLQKLNWPQFLASCDALEVIIVTESLSHWWLADITDDHDDHDDHKDHDESDDHDNHNERVDHDDHDDHDDNDDNDDHVDHDDHDDNDEHEVM